MDLYLVVGSPKSRKTFAVANQLKNLDINIKYLDFFAGQHKSPDYLAINPHGKVPALVDGNYEIWESNAINQYLIEKNGGSNLYPEDLKTRTEINKWLNWETAHFNSAFGIIAFEAVAKPVFMGLDGNQAIIDWATENLKGYANILDKYLEGREFIAGNNITLADYAFLTNDFFKDKIPFDWSPYPNINLYFERMGQDEHWLASSPNSPEEIGRIPA